MGRLSPEIACHLDEAKLTIATKYRGKDLKIIQLGEGKESLAYLLNRETHKDLKIIDLERIGAIYSVELSGNALDTINFHVDPSKETISAETVLDMPNAEEERNEIVNAIKNNSAITVLDDGATSDEVFAELKKGVEEMNSKLDSSNGVKAKISQYGPMWVEIEIEKPSTFGELIDKVDGIRNSLLA